MTYFILSLIMGISAAAIVWILFILEKKLSPNILKRLDKIKRKSNIYRENEEKNKIDINEISDDYRFKILEQVLQDYKFTEQIKKIMILAGVKWNIDIFIIVCCLCASPFLIFLFTSFKLMALFSVFAFFVPLIYLNQLINKRFLDFSRQFPDALNLMSSSLRAGHPLIAAIDIVTAEMPKPISDVFDTAKKNIALGIDMKDAFYGMTKIMPQSIDLRFFVTAVLIQKEVGGNLAELLDNLSNTIRERFKLLGQLRVQTAQTKLSGTIVGIVPAIILLIIFFMNPDYIKPLFNTKDGQLALISAIALSVAGFIFIKKISNIEI